MKKYEAHYMTCKKECKAKNRAWINIVLTGAPEVAFKFISKCLFLIAQLNACLPCMITLFLSIWLDIEII